ncbi:hypothetical protein QOT17_008682 [Balamuthia mandrillaris]
MPIELVSVRLFPYRPYHTWQHPAPTHPKLADKDDGPGSGTGDSLGDIRLMQSLLTTEMLLTFHGKPNEDPNIFLTLFDCYATAAGWSHQDYILHFEGQLHDNTDVVKTQLLNCFQHHDRVTAKIMKLEAFLTDFSETQVLEKFITGTVPDLKEKFLQQEDIANMADALNLARDWEGRKHAKRSLDHWSKSSRQEKKDTFGSALQDTKGKSGSQSQVLARRTVLVEGQD